MLRDEKAFIKRRKFCATLSRKFRLRYIFFERCRTFLPSLHRLPYTGAIRRARAHYCLRFDSASRSGMMVAASPKYCMNIALASRTLHILFDFNTQYRPHVAADKIFFAAPLTHVR